jgi:hypothetical protein
MNTSTSELLRGAMARARCREQPPPKAPDLVDDALTLDSADDYTIKDISLKAVSAIHQWVETDDLDDGESLASRLMHIFVGIADRDIDGEIGEDEQSVIDVALNSAWDYLEKCGVAEEDIDALLNEWDDDAAVRVRDLVASVLPDGDDEAGAAIDSFVFSPADQEPALDAAYRKVMAVRGGKKVRIRKRVAGTVRLSGRQKVAVAKMLRRSHSAGANMRRLKSMRQGRKMGLHK